MEFWITVVELLRRKRVVIPALLVGVALGALAYVGTPKTYESSTTMVLTTTEFGGTETQDPTSPESLTNPLLNFSDSLRTTSAILIQSMNVTETVRQLGATGPTKLVVDDGRSNPDLLGLNGPFLYILVQSTSPDEAARIVAEAQKLMRQKLQELQQSLGAPNKTFVSLVDVVPPSAPEADGTRATKLGVTALVLGILMSLSIAYLQRQVRARRRARRAPRGAAADELPLDDGPGADADADKSPSARPAMTADDYRIAAELDDLEVRAVVDAAKVRDPGDDRTSDEDPDQLALVPATPPGSVSPSPPRGPSVPAAPIKKSRSGPQPSKKTRTRRP